MAAGETLIAKRMEPSMQSGIQGQEELKWQINKENHLPQLISHRDVHSDTGFKQEDKSQSEESYD